MNAIPTTHPRFRLLRSLYLRWLLAYIERDIALDQQWLQHLPKRIKEHERTAGAIRGELVQLGAQ